MLFFGAHGEKKLIADYSGRGSLGSWLATVAVHRAWKEARRGRRNVAFDAKKSEPAPSDPELDYFRRHYAVELKSAINHALESLPDRAKKTLRQSVIDGLSIDEIGRRAHVHRATAARWLAMARTQILDRVHRDLGERLNLSPDEVSALRGVADTDLEVSIERLLPDVGRRRKSDRPRP
jgi:RNA polymerase sigma-70 factor (ECF subfamily)